MEASVKRISLKSKSVSPGRIELNYEIRLRKESSEFVNELDRLPECPRRCWFPIMEIIWGNSMLKHKHIDKICFGAMAAAVLLTLLLLSGKAPGVSRAVPARNIKAGCLIRTGFTP